MIQHTTTPPVSSSEDLSAFEPFIAFLREELQECGALLSLLKEQQKSIIHRETEQIVAYNEAIDRQIKSGAAIRLQRESELDSLGLSLNVDGPPFSLRMLLPLFPESIQCLINAIVEEFHAAVAKTQFIANQNQVLVKRAAEVTREIISTIHSQSITKTYDRKGSLKSNFASDISIIQASA